ncbi:MAG: hypothetical protein K5785_00800 [Nitrosarchaeum sp.]|nr:hypothetical protein [Nitrosarchaeum sp.]
MREAEERVTRLVLQKNAEIANTANLRKMLGEKQRTLEQTQMTLDFLKIAIEIYTKELEAREKK